MNPRGVLCVFLRHRWREADDVHESYPVLRCTRCGRLRALAPGTSDPAQWTSRYRSGVETWSGDRPRR
ncbi:MAG: hypothetical protein E6G08_03890 [Actinobacteria bacterium]|nr:MAG: hypothetical protein E6G08_03890 [Actinomycetota bacterium]